jgi:hypothetical protein
MISETKRKLLTKALGEERCLLVHDFCIYMYEQGAEGFEWVKEFMGKEGGKMKNLRVHNGRLAYQYVWNGVHSYSDNDLIIQLATEAGYVITYTGNGNLNIDEHDKEFMGKENV